MTADHAARAYLVDLDGTLVIGNKVLPGAISFVEAAQDRLALISNDAEHTPWQLARGLRRLGLRIAPERIVLAGTTALDLIARDRPAARIMLLGSRALHIYALRVGLWPVRDHPDVVLVARDRHFTYGKLAAAANAVRDGAELVVANPDLVHPGEAGSVVPETGALLSAILACAGPAPYRIIGKPEPELYRRALACIGAEAQDVVVVGDNPATDGAGAARLGIRFVPANGGVAAALPAFAAA
jgi:HAD superfamily hydrolase (TIGR01450 family)